MRETNTWEMERREAGNKRLGLSVAQVDSILREECCYPYIVWMVFM